MPSSHVFLCTPNLRFAWLSCLLLIGLCCTGVTWEKNVSSRFYTVSWCQYILSNMSKETTIHQMTQYLEGPITAFFSPQGVFYLEDMQHAPRSTVFHKVLGGKRIIAKKKKSHRTADDRPGLYSKQDITTHIHIQNAYPVSWDSNLLWRPFSNQELLRSNQNSTQWFFSLFPFVTASAHKFMFFKSNMPEKATTQRSLFKHSQIQRRTCFTNSRPLQDGVEDSDAVTRRSSILQQEKGPHRKREACPAKRHTVPFHNKISLEFGVMLGLWPK